MIACGHWKHGVCARGKGGGLPSHGVCRHCLSGHVIPTHIPPAPPAGPGTELKRLLARIGITKGSCACNAHAAEMDAKGADWCIENIDTIVGWLREEAEKRRLPFADFAARLLVRRAVRKARLQKLASPNFHS